jgi:hypothetical protein
MTFLHQPKQEVSNDDNLSEDTHVYYTIFGKHKLIDNEGNPILNKETADVFAKKIIGNTTKYFIKIGLYGRIYNPIGAYSEGRHTKFLTKTGKKEYDFKQVPQKVFDMYINFLRSKNIAWLNNAEREMT